MRVAFQGEPGAFSEAAAIQLLGGEIRTVPRATFEAAFTAIAEGAADALLAPVENSLAGSVVRVFDLLMESRLAIVAETILPIEMQLIAAPGASLADIRSVASHPMALAQCERFFAAHPQWKRVPAEDTAGSVREALSRGDKSSAAIAGRRAAEHYHMDFSPGSQSFSGHAPGPPPRRAPRLPRALCQARSQSPEDRKPSHPRPPLGISIFHRRRSRDTRPSGCRPRRSALRHQRTPRPRPLPRRVSLDAGPPGMSDKKKAGWTVRPSFCGFLNFLISLA